MKLVLCFLLWTFHCFMTVSGLQPEENTVQSRCEQCPAIDDKSIGFALGKMWATNSPIPNAVRNFLVQNPVEARRLPFVVPVMYNLGVITTLLVVLTVLMFKGLTLGLILLILALGKKYKMEHTGGAGTRPIHIHLHGGHNKKASHDYIYNTPGIWDRSEDYDVNGTLLDHIWNPRAYTDSE